MMPSGIIDRLEAGSIEPGSFGHREHLEAAFELLQREPFLDAVARYARAIERFAAAAGAADKFNVTITIAFLSLMAERMAGAQYVSFEDFLDASPDLLGWSLGRWYSTNRLASPLARRVFLMPDQSRPSGAPTGE